MRPRHHGVNRPCRAAGSRKRREVRAGRDDSVGIDTAATAPGKLRDHADKRRVVDPGDRLRVDRSGLALLGRWLGDGKRGFYCLQTTLCLRVGARFVPQENVAGEDDGHGR